jgi:DNA-binding transcriptional LysR family regulator
MDTTLAQLHTLETVARLASFSRAAEALSRTQPAISLQVRELERQMGQELLDRSGGRPRATAAGEVLIAASRRAFRELELARSEILALRGETEGELRLGAPETAALYYLPRVLERLKERHPGVLVRLAMGDNDRLAASVLSGELDAALATLPVASRRLEATPAFSDRGVVIAPPRAPWLGRRRISVEELCRHPLVLYGRTDAIRRRLDAFFRKHSVRPRVAIEIARQDAIKKFVAAGFGLSIVSSLAAVAEERAGELVVLRLVPALARTVGVIRRPRHAATPALAAFLAVVAEH